MGEKENTKNLNELDFVLFCIEGISKKLGLMHKRLMTRF